jgi:hypothetical protein
VSSVRRIAICLLASVGLLLASALPASAEPVGVLFRVELTGEAEVTSTGVPNQGDLDATGTATVTINPGLGQVCWTIEVAGDIQPIRAAHIHVAPATAPGPIVVPLEDEDHMFTPVGCTEVSRELALAIILNPSAYYVNVHNAEFPAGALRGQLDSPGLI